MDSIKGKKKFKFFIKGNKKRKVMTVHAFHYWPKLKIRTYFPNNKQIYYPKLHMVYESPNSLLFWKYSNRLFMVGFEQPLTCHPLGHMKHTLNTIVFGHSNNPTFCSL